MVIQFHMMDAMNANINAKIVVLNVFLESVIDVNQAGNGIQEYLDVSRYVEMVLEQRLKYVMIEYTNWVMSVWHANLNAPIIVLLAITVFVKCVIQDINQMKQEMIANLFVVIIQLH